MMQIEAQEALLTISAISYPHMSKDGQRKLHKQLHKTGYPKNEEPMTLDKLEAWMRMYG